jgi:hypothetical protein
MLRPVQPREQNPPRRSLYPYALRTHVLALPLQLLHDDVHRVANDRVHVAVASNGTARTRRLSSCGRMWQVPSHGSDGHTDFQGRVDE